MSRALAGIDGKYGDRVSTRVALLASVDPVISEGETGPSIGVTLHEAWVRINLDRAGHLMVGRLQMPFGLGLDYGQAGWFYVPGKSEFLDLSTRAGITAELQTALMWQFDLPAGIEFDAALAQPVDGSTEFRPWKADVAGRLRWHQPDGGAVLGLSGMLKSRPNEHSTGAWHAYGGYFLGLADLRILAEAMGTFGDENRGLGFDLNAAATTPLDLGPIVSLTGLVRLEYWDPDWTLIYDETIAFDASASVDIDGGVSLGILYDLRVPRDAALAIEHDLTFQVRAQF
jgi:hypothetical protein